MLLGVEGMYRKQEQPLKISYLLNMKNKRGKFKLDYIVNFQNSYSVANMKQNQYAIHYL